MCLVSSTPTVALVSASVVTNRGDEAVSRDASLSDEAELIERARRDLREFAVLYERHVDRIYRFVYRRVQNGGVAEEITSEVFTKALHAMPRYQYTGSPFAAWLYRIAANTIADRGRNFRSCLPIELFDSLFRLPFIFEREGEVVMGQSIVGFKFQRLVVVRNRLVPGLVAREIEGSAPIRLSCLRKTRRRNQQNQNQSPHD